MKDMEKHSIRVNDICYLTAHQAAKLCEMEYAAFYAHIDAFETFKFANILMVNMDQVIEYNNHRLYIKAFKERKNK